MIESLKRTLAEREETINILEEQLKEAAQENKRIHFLKSKAEEKVFEYEHQYTVVKEVSHIQQLKKQDIEDELVRLRLKKRIEDNRIDELNQENKKFAKKINNMKRLVAEMQRKNDSLKIERDEALESVNVFQQDLKSFNYLIKSFEGIDKVIEKISISMEAKEEGTLKEFASVERLLRNLDKGSSKISSNFETKSPLINELYKGREFIKLHACFNRMFNTVKQLTNVVERVCYDKISDFDNRDIDNTFQ